MKTIKKIQPKVPVEIDFDALAQKIKASKASDTEGVAIEDPTIITEASKVKSVKTAIPTKAAPERILKKAGRKKTNTETMHRFALDLPEWLFEQIRQDAQDNFSTVRGQILKMLLVKYKL